MTIDEINQALQVYKNWIYATDYDEIDVVLIRKVINRCAELESEVLDLRQRLEEMKKRGYIIE